MVCLWHIQTKRTVPLVCKGEAGVKFSAKQKRALETAEQSQKTAIATAVSSADGAKILNSIDKLVESLEKSAKSFGKFDTTSFQEIILSSGVFRRERRAVFILGAMWIALVRGWRRECVVSGMETRFQ